MDFMYLAQMFAVLCLASLVIMQACNLFEPASGYLGRNLSGGAKGTLVDAVASSLPELMVTLSFIASGKPELILAGVAVCAGSAMFNSCLIPALSIYYAQDKNGKPIKSFKLDKKAQFRNGMWLLAVEAVLLTFLGFNEFTMLMGGTLCALYVMFAMHTIKISNDAGDGPDDYEFESLESETTFQAIINFDINKLFFGDKPFTTFSAWVSVIVSVLLIGAACHFLAVSVEGIAVAVGIPVYFSAVVLGAAATSLPDTIMSVKSAKNGEADDAVGNAIGSNIFDTTISLGLPIVIWLAIEGGALPIMQSTDLTILRIFVFGISACVIASLVLSADNVGRKTAGFLLCLYAVWISYIGYAGYMASIA